RLEPGRDGDREALAAGIEPPLVFGAEEREAQAIVGEQVLRAFRCAVLLEIARRGADVERRRGELARDEPRILELRYADRDVHPLLDEVDQAIVHGEL